MCEEFGCLPSEAAAEPPALVQPILALRAYARFHAQAAAAKTPAAMPGGPMTTLYWRNVARLKALDEGKVDEQADPGEER